MYHVYVQVHSGDTCMSTNMNRLQFSFVRWYIKNVLKITQIKISIRCRESVQILNDTLVH